MIYIAATLLGFIPAANCYKDLATPLPVETMASIRSYSVASGNYGINRELQRFGNSVFRWNYSIDRGLLAFQNEPLAGVIGHKFEMYTFMLGHAEEPRRGVIFVVSAARQSMSPSGAK